MPEKQADRSAGDDSHRLVERLEHESLAEKAARGLGPGAQIKPATAANNPFVQNLKPSQEAQPAEPPSQE